MDALDAAILHRSGDSLSSGPVAPAALPFVMAVASDGLRVGLSTRYMDGGKEILRSLGGTWSAGLRMWVYRNQRFREVVLKTLPDRIRQRPPYACDDLLEQVMSAFHARQPRLFSQHLDVQLIPLKSGGHLCQFNYDEVTVEAMRKLQGRWHKPAQGWELGSDLKGILRLLSEMAGVDEDLVFVHDQIIELEDLVAPPASEVSLSVGGADFPERNGNGDTLTGSSFISATTAPLETPGVDADRIQALVKQHGLYDYQGTGVAHLMGATSALLGDDMGLGKSRQAAVATGELKGVKKALIVCPATLRINWEREILKVYPHAWVGHIGEDAQDKLMGAEWHICTYERLGAVVRDQKTVYEVMTIDEAHFLKEHDVNRTRNALLLAQRIPRRYLLTGTPFLSRETEVHMLLRLSGHPLGMMRLADFKEQYSGSAHNRAKLGKELASWMLRREKDVLTNLKGKSEQVVYVQPDAGMHLYREVMANTDLLAMAKVTKLRQVLEFLKINWLLVSLKALPEDVKALVFCEYHDTVHQLMHGLKEAKIGAVSLTGADSAKVRQRAVDGLQDDEKVRVFIGTTAAAGVGLTLTAANYVFFASLPWTPALKRQAEDRAYRNGQERHVIVKVPLIPNTVDEQIYDLLKHKTDVADGVLSAASDSRKELEALICKAVSQ